MLICCHIIYNYHLMRQAYERKKAVGEVDKSVRPPGPLEIVREILKEEGVTVRAVSTPRQRMPSPKGAMTCLQHLGCAVPVSL